MMFSPIDLSALPPEREAALRSIYRYHMFERMLYRPNLWEHALRVHWLVEELLPTVSAFIDLDAEKARVMALVHDDAEIVTGDVQAGHKARMTAEQLRELDEQELRGIDTLSSQYPELVHGYAYRDLLVEMVHKETPESQLVGLADKLDARCETFHEIYAGNFSFITSTAFYITTLQQIGNKLPLVSRYVAEKPHALLQEMGPLPPDGMVRVSHFEPFNKPHTRGSLDVPSRFPFYDAWRTLVVERGGEDGVSWLTERRE